jgi:hypothetical protein
MIPRLCGQTRPARLSLYLPFPAQNSCSRAGISP